MPKISKNIPYLKTRIAVFAFILIIFFAVFYFFNGYSHLQTVLSDLMAESYPEKNEILNSPYIAVKSGLKKINKYNNITHLNISHIGISKKYLVEFEASESGSDILSPYHYIFELEEKNGIFKIVDSTDIVVYAAKEISRKQAEEDFYFDFKNIGNVFWNTEDEWIDSNDKSPLELFALKEGGNIILPGEIGRFYKRNSILPRDSDEMIYPYSITSNVSLVIEIAKKDSGQ